ncbi:hypothetical protein GCM10009416_38090 [Craurococcus roseus]|uniref:PhnA-like protein n=1 Tax=Craurococcus roseus TaxID=77585 RepID=A0ABP3QRU0_9PROT
MQARTPIDPYAAGSATIPGAAAGRAALAEGAPALPPRVSWGAIIAGAVIAVMIGLMLNVLGAAVGVTAVDAVQGETPDASTFGIGAAVWLLVATLVGLGVGAYAAARLSGTADKTDAALHGVGVWAIGFLLSAVLLGNVAAGAASSVFTTASSLLGGAAQTAGSAVSGIASQVSPQAALDRARAGLSSPSEPARMTTEQRGAEITSILGSGIAGGGLSDAQRQRLAALVAAETGIPQQEAAQRVQSYEAQAQQTAREAAERARRAADAAAIGAATAAYAVFGTLLLGAIVSIFAARAGARDLYGVRVAAGARRTA